MTSPNRPARLNRSLLGLAGLLLTLAGGFALATHYELLHLLGPDGSIVHGTDRPATWALYVTAVAAILLGLVTLRWLVAQLIRWPTSPTWRLERHPEDGRTELSTSAAAEPLNHDISTHPGVQDVRTVITGTHNDPTLGIRIATTPGTDISVLTRHLDEYVLPRLKQALDLPTLHTRIEYRFTTNPTDRVR